MRFDAGRLKDLEMLENQLKGFLSVEKRHKIESVINQIKRQAENENLSKGRDVLLEARRRVTNAVGDVNITRAREEANKLEEQIHKAYGS